MNQKSRMFASVAALSALIVFSYFQPGNSKNTVLADSADAASFGASDDSELEPIIITAPRYYPKAEPRFLWEPEADTEENFIGEFVATIRPKNKSELHYRKSPAHKLVPVKQVVSVPFKHDKAKDGWTLLEDTPFDGKQFVPDLVEFLKPGESYVSGEVMKQRAKELNAHLGQRHAEYLLDHQELILKEWRGNYFLVFPGTVWQDSDGDRSVPFLNWDGGRWYLDFYWLRYDWYDDFRLVRSREPASR